MRLKNPGNGGGSRKLKDRDLIATGRVQITNILLSLLLLI